MFSFKYKKHREKFLALFSFVSFSCLVFIMFLIAIKYYKSIFPFKSHRVASFRFATFPSKNPS
jgi:hypothetical protein